MQGAPRGEALVQSVLEWGWRQEANRNKVKEGIQGSLLDGGDPEVSLEE